MLKIGLIGCGNVSVMHTESIKNIDGAQLVCVCDCIKSKADAKAKQYNCKAYYDYEVMLNNESLDAVHICLPHHLHIPVANYALYSGVNVLTEKPMSIGYDDAALTVWLAEDKGLKYGVIFQCRYNSASRLVKKYLDNGSLGKILSARVTLTWSRPSEYYKGSEWKGTWDKEGGGVIIDQAIHSLDLANWFINSEIKEVQMSMHNRKHSGIEVEDCAEGVISYKDGVELSVYAMNYYGGDDPIEIRLLCENGRAVMSYDEAAIDFKNGERVQSVKDRAELEFLGGKPYWGFKHLDQIRNFYRAIRNEEALDISGKEALKVQKLVYEIYKEGRKTLNTKLGGK